ncbi:MAG: methyltransferase [Marmoricola sp.]
MGESDELGPDALAGVIYGYKVAAALHACVALGIPEALGGGPLSVEELSVATECDPTALGRLVRMLCAHGALVAEGDGYRNSGLTASLRSAAARDRFLGWLALPAITVAWQSLAAAVRTGQPPFSIAHGYDLHTFFHDNPQERRLYDRANGSTLDEFEEVADAIDLSSATTVVCVGGASGIELVPLLRTWPNLRGILADLPDALSGADAMLAEYGVSDRVEVVATDARRSVPAGDAYMLSTVLRCMDDDDATALLRACADAALPGATMYVVEFPIPDGPPRPVNATGDLTAWVAYGGGDRTIQQWRALHEAAGWQNLEATPLEEPTAVLVSTLGS